MRAFDISIAQDTVAVKQGEQASLRFTVTNVSGRDLRALLRLVPDNEEHADWLRIEGEGRREVESAQSDTIVVKIKPPRGAPPGAAKFRLVVANEENPDEDFAEAVARFTVEQAPAPERRPRPWWIVAAAAGVIVIAVAVIALSLRPEPIKEVYAITDVMVTDDSSRVPDDYTGVSREQPTTPYIPGGQVGARVTASNVNENMPYPGTNTSIWVKYERLPVDSDKEVLVDIKVCRWEKLPPLVKRPEPDGGVGPMNRWDWKDPGTMKWLVKWEERLPEGPGWKAASGYSMETNGDFTVTGQKEAITGGLTTGLPWQIHRKGLAVKYEPLSEAPTRIIGLRLADTPRTPDGQYRDAEESVIRDSEGRPVGKEERAGMDIQWSDHHVPAGRCHLMKRIIRSDLTGATGVSHLSLHGRGRR